MQGATQTSVVEGSGSGWRGIDPVKAQYQARERLANLIQETILENSSEKLEAFVKKLEVSHNNLINEAGFRSPYEFKGFVACVLEETHNVEVLINVVPWARTGY